MSRNISGVETDVNLKRLFKACGKDFLWLTGDEEATLLSIDVLELQEIKRSVDCLMRLASRIVFISNLEFRISNRVTVLYLVPPAPAESEIMYRVMLAGVEVNAWRFGVVRLWEVKAQAALASGAPGLMALVPLLEGGDPAAVWEAARRIRQLLPGDRMSDPEAILWLLARDRDNMEQLDEAIGRHHMQALLDLIKRSPWWQEAESEGEARGKAEGEARGKVEGETRGEARGRLVAQREMCLKLVARHHPALLAEAAPRIAACDNCDLLQSWILAASEPDTETLARLIA